VHLCNVQQEFPSVLNYCRRFAHLVEMIESDSDEATTEVISQTEGWKRWNALCYM
jgi:hypothetical protein